MTPPECQVGDEVACLALRDLVRVVGWWTRGPVPWPLVRRPGQRRPSLLLAGDLVHAVRAMDRNEVARLWGVGTTTVTAWRRALGVERPAAASLANLAKGRRVPQSEARRRASAERMRRLQAEGRGFRRTATPLPAEVVARYAAGELTTVAAVAAEVGCSIGTALSKLKAAGVYRPAPKGRRYDPLPPDVVARYVAGQLATAADVAAVIGCSRDTARRRLKAAGVLRNISDTMRLIAALRPS